MEDKFLILRLSLLVVFLCIDLFSTEVLVSKEAIKFEEKIDENSPEGFRNKVVSALRGKFGQHKVKKQS